jgi:hypothetical protein
MTTCTMDDFTSLQPQSVLATLARYNQRQRQAHTYMCRASLLPGTVQVNEHLLEHDSCAGHQAQEAASSCKDHGQAVRHCQDLQLRGAHRRGWSGWKGSPWALFSSPSPRLRP